MLVITQPPAVITPSYQQCNGGEGAFQKYLTSLLINFHDCSKFKSKLQTKHFFQKDILEINEAYGKIFLIMLLNDEGRGIVLSAVQWSHMRLTRAWTPVQSLAETRECFLAKRF